MINNEIRSIIADTVSDYANNHWHSYDFESEYDRQRYLEELADGNGWNDDVADQVLEDLDGQEWEDEEGLVHEINVNDQDVIDAVYDQIEKEADYWAD